MKRRAGAARDSYGHWSAYDEKVEPLANNHEAHWGSIGEIQPALTCSGLGFHRSHKQDISLSLGVNRNHSEFSRI
jgi:hypothetical protein